MISKKKKGKDTMIAHGFIVLNNDTNVGWSKKYIDRYLELREQMFGYAPDHPQQRIPQGYNKDLGIPVILLKNANRGLLKTMKEAESLRQSLLQDFSGCPLEIVCMEYPEAASIYWIRS